MRTAIFLAVCSVILSPSPLAQLHDSNPSPPRLQLTALPPPVTVEYMRSTALELSRVQWTATARDVSEHCLRNTPDLLPKSFVIGKTNYGVPYRWGGMDSLTVFESLHARGFSAGEHTIDITKHGHACTTGIDCSGLVSLAWGQHSDRDPDPKERGTKYGTATLCKIADVKYDPGSKDNPNPTFNWSSDLHPGDAVITKSGHHVLLFDAYYRLTKSGTVGLCFFEGHGDVADHHGVDFTDKEITGGTVFRYRNIVGPIEVELATSCGGEKRDTSQPDIAVVR